MGRNTLAQETKRRLVQLLSTHAEMFRQETVQMDNQYGKEYLDFLNWIDKNIS